MSQIITRKNELCIIYFFFNIKFEFKMKFFKFQKKNLISNFPSSIQFRLSQCMIRPVYKKQLRTV